MDIQVSSNFERLLFDLAGRDGTTTAAWMAGFEATKRLALPESARAEAARIFASARIDGADMAGALRWAREAYGQIIDPHTAIGLAAAQMQPGDEPMVTLATAHPAKFRDAVERACGVRPPQPESVGHLFQREERYSVLPADLATIEGWIAQRAQPA
jgi:threonine synthase